MSAFARVEPEPRFIRIADGVTAQVIERAPTSPLPRRLELLLDRLAAVRSYPVRLAGTRRACTDAEHAYQLWMWGLYAGFELRLALCPFCGTVEVRDVSLDILPGLSPGSLEPRRRSDLLGWYSGQRPGGRTYR